jgi:putative membrane protein
MKNTPYIKTTLFLVFLVIIPLIGAYSIDTIDSSEEMTTVNNKTTSDNSITEKEAKFLTVATGINLEEIKLSELALQKSMMENVKQLAQMMHESHVKSLKELTALAEKKMISLPIKTTNDMEDAYIKLSSLSGTDFDTEYCNRVVNAHKYAIGVFEKAVKTTGDADIKAWIIATLPELRNHVTYALACQKQSGKIEITQGE